jgi:hypothetical protein
LGPFLLLDQRFAKIGLPRGHTRLSASELAEQGFRLGVACFAE